MEPMTIDNLRMRRLKRRLRLRDVAKAAGVSIASLSAWERGARKPKPEHLKKWKRALR